MPNVYMVTTAIGTGRLPRLTTPFNTLPDALAYIAYVTRDAEQAGKTSRFTLRRVPERLPRERA